MSFTKREEQRRENPSDPILGYLKGSPIADIVDMAALTMRVKEGRLDPDNNADDRIYDALKAYVDFATISPGKEAFAESNRASDAQYFHNSVHTKIDRLDGAFCDAVGEKMVELIDTHANAQVVGKDGKVNAKAASASIEEFNERLHLHLGTTLANYPTEGLHASHGEEVDPHGLHDVHMTSFEVIEQDAHTAGYEKAADFLESIAPKIIVQAGKGSQIS